MYQAKEEKSIKSSRGITLIALIITIIVLLILAGVSISMVIGENGVLNRAQDASKKTNDAKDEEARQMSIAEAAMNFENTEYEDKNGEKVTIPAGFAVSQVEGENTVEDGLVIIDSKGNEFVWIPCNNIEEYENIIGDDSWGEYEYSSKEDIIWTDGEQIELAKNSIINYGGFFVGRYEAGVPSNAPFYVSNSSANKTYTTDESKNNEKLISNLKPVSKKGNQVWNFISQKNAEIVSKKMYEENSSISSYLIDSKSWNYICKSIFNDKLKKPVTKAIELGNYRLTNTSHYLNINGLYAIHYYEDGDWKYAQNYKYGEIQNDELPGKTGQYLELATGLCEDFKMYNIYDMAGNFWEWTSEKSKENIYDSDTDSYYHFVVFRDTGFAGDGQNDNCSMLYRRGDHWDSWVRSNVGFRVVLYLK